MDVSRPLTQDCMVVLRRVTPLTGKDMSYFVWTAMPYMIPYYQSGFLVTFRCTDCDWTYRIQNPCSAPIPCDEGKEAQEQYVTHCCSEFSSKTAKSGLLILVSHFP